MAEKWDYTSAFIVYLACVIMMGLLTCLMYVGKIWEFFVMGALCTVVFVSAAILMAKEARAKGEWRA